jgi:hypothetical protein
MAVNLILALFWLVLAVIAAAYLLARPAEGGVHLFGSDVSAGWMAGIAGFMFVYNMLRWWVAKARQKEQLAEREMLAQNRHRTEERNPEFDFGEKKDQGP